MTIIAQRTKLISKSALYHHLYTVILSVPAAVSEITTSNGGRSDALQVSWHPSLGVVDSYLVRLQDGSRTIHTLAVSHSSTPECSFSSLLAGRLYSVVIVTRSGSLENTTSVQARTRKNPIVHLIHLI